MTGWVQFREDPWPKNGRYVGVPTFQEPPDPGVMAAWFWQLGFTFWQLTGMKRSISVTIHRYPPVMIKHGNGKSTVYG